MRKTIELSNAEYFNHGCRNYATATDNGDGTAIITSVVTCHSCWQVGHDGDYEYATVGQLIKLKDWQNDILEEEESWNTNIQHFTELQDEGYEVVVVMVN